jgi:hypothetical protein
MSYTIVHTKNDTKTSRRLGRLLNLAGRSAWIAALLLAIGLSTTAQAGTVQYTLSMSSNYGLLQNPTSPSAQTTVSSMSSAAVATANNNPVFELTNTSVSADFTEVKLTLLDPQSMIDALKILQSPPGATAAAPFTNSVWGTPTKSIDISLPTPLAPNQSMFFTINLTPNGGFSNMSWVAGYKNILFNSMGVGNTTVNVSYINSGNPGDPSGTFSTTMPSLSNFNAITIASQCCSTPATQMLSTSIIIPNTSVPEPGSIVLMALGALPVAAVVRKKYRKTQPAVAKQTA